MTKFIHIDKFRSRVKTLVQGGGKEMMFSRSEALCLQGDIAQLLLLVIELQGNVIDAQKQQIEVGGGEF